MELRILVVYLLAGGTESILMACKAYREYSRSSSPEI